MATVRRAASKRAKASTPRVRMKSLEQLDRQWRNIYSQIEGNTPRKQNPRETARYKRALQAYKSTRDTIYQNLTQTKGGHAYEYLPEYTDGENVSPWFYQVNRRLPVQSNGDNGNKEVRAKRDYSGDYFDKAVREYERTNSQSKFSSVREGGNSSYKGRITG